MPTDSDRRDFGWLRGRTVESVEGLEIGSMDVLFRGDGWWARLTHHQDCCEHVRLEDIAGDVADLIGAPIALAEAVTSRDQCEGLPEYWESFTWTFYKLATKQGYVTLRWLGESNGYYSEEVSFMGTADAE
jgi:hypothetical protein